MSSSPSCAEHRTWRRFCPGSFPSFDQRTPYGSPGPSGPLVTRVDVGDNLVRRAALETGLVDVKVAAIGDDWSGLRFVWRRERRDEVRLRPAPKS
jgi:hypothetical protein